MILKKFGQYINEMMAVAVDNFQSLGLMITHIRRSNIQLFVARLVIARNDTFCECS